MNRPTVREEDFKKIRDFIYECVSYYSKDDKGIIYNGEYNQIQIEQANILQQHICAYVDMFSQIICDNRTFDNKYFENKIRS